MLVIILIDKIGFDNFIKIILCIKNYIKEYSRAIESQKKMKINSEVIQSESNFNLFTANSEASTCSYI